MQRPKEHRRRAILSAAAEEFADVGFEFGDLVGEGGEVGAERSGGEYELKEATMYSSVRRLEVDGDIEWYWSDESQGGRRKYFRITAKGKSTYANNKSNWEYAKRILDNLF